MHYYGATRWVFRIAKRVASISSDTLFSALQVEYLVVTVDDEARKVRLSLAQVDILKSLARDEALWKAGGSVPGLKVKCAGRFPLMPGGRSNCSQRRRRTPSLPP